MAERNDVLADSSLVVEKKRTNRQNRALHKMFSQLADELNDAGMDMRRTLSAGVDIPWNATTVKEFLWRPVQKSQLLKDSTTDLTTKEIDEVFDTLNRFLGERTGVHVDFPSIESLINQGRLK